MQLIKAEPINSSPKMKSKYHFKFEELEMYQKALDFADVVNEQINSFTRESFEFDLKMPEL